MKRVVIVAPQFPPCNLPAVHRNRLLAMHLPKFGWQVTVLSVEPRFYEGPLDWELERLVPPWLEVVRTRALPARPLRLVGDIGVRALWWHYRQLGRMIRDDRIDLVYISIPPNYSAVLGPLVYRRYGVPYAVDYQDPWVHPWPGCEVPLSKAWCAFQLGRVLEPVVLRHARLVTAVAPGYCEGAVRRSPWLDDSSWVTMPVGGEEADFRALDDHPRPPALFDPSDGNWHIVYAGAMIPPMHATLEALLRALAWVKDRDPASASRLRLDFIGTGAPGSGRSSCTVSPWAERLGVSHMVREHPARLPYLDVLNHLRHAQAVLIIGSSEPHYTPSKAFQAVLSRRPVIGILHARSTAAAILREANAGPVVTFDEATPVGSRVKEIAEALLAAAGGSGDYRPDRVNWEAFHAHSAEAMAGKLAAAFDAALERPGRGHR